MSKFKAGDIVRPKPGDLNIVVSHAGVGKFGEYTVVTYTEELGVGYVSVRASGQEHNGSSIALQATRFIPVFKVGDTVRVKEGCTALLMARFVDKDLTVDMLTADRARVVDAFGNAYNANRDNFELVAKKAVRVEGDEILPADIKVGDEILVTKTRDGFTQMRQGTVGTIKRQSHNRAVGLEGAHLFFTKGEFDPTKDRLNWGERSGETFTLVKAAPERDELLDRLTGSLKGQAITFRETLARKLNDERWVVIYGSSVLEYSTEHLRFYIAKSPVTWLKAEG